MGSVMRPDYHYCQFFPQRGRAYACGAANNLNATYRPEHVFCPECRNTDVWKEDTTTIEIGFDGDSDRWFARKQGEPG